MTFSQLGHIPFWLDDENPKSTKEQMEDGYGHGGGWRPMKGFTLRPDNMLVYPGDPMLGPLATTKLRDETIVFYPHAWVAIIQPDRSFEVARID